MRTPGAGSRGALRGWENVTLGHNVSGHLATWTCSHLGLPARPVSCASAAGLPELARGPSAREIGPAMPAAHRRPCAPTPTCPNYEHALRAGRTAQSQARFQQDRKIRYGLLHSVTRWAPMNSRSPAIISEMPHPSYVSPRGGLAEWQKTVKFRPCPGGCRVISRSRRPGGRQPNCPSPWCSGSLACLTT